MMNVKVTYPDGTFSIRTFLSQVRSTNDETIEFQSYFYYRLLKEGLPVLTAYGEYSLTDEPLLISR